jgi:hypothetical protein
MDSIEALKPLVSFLTSFGGFGVAIAFGWAIYTKRLRLGREVEERDVIIAELKLDRDRGCRRRCARSRTTSDSRSPTRRRWGRWHPSCSPKTSHDRPDDKRIRPPAAPCRSSERSGS